MPYHHKVANKFVGMLGEDNPIRRAMTGMNNLKGNNRFVDFVENNPEQGGLGLEWNQLNKMNALKIVGTDDASYLMQPPKEEAYEDTIKNYMNIIGKYNLVDEEARPDVERGLLGMGYEGLNQNYDAFRDTYARGG